MNASPVPQCSAIYERDSYHVLCQRRQGHEGDHWDYSGKWDHSTESRCEPARCTTSAPPKREP